MRLPDVNTGKLLGLKYKLVCCFKLVVDMARGDIWEFVNDMDGPAFLKRELMGWVLVGQSSRPCKWRAHDLFLQCKKHCISYIGVGTPDWRHLQSARGKLRLVLELVNDSVEMWMGHVLQWELVAGEGSFQGGEGTRVETGVVEDLAEVGALQKLTLVFEVKTSLAGFGRGKIYELASL